MKVHSTTCLTPSITLPIQQVSSHGGEKNITVGEYKKWGVYIEQIKHKGEYIHYYGHYLADPKGRRRSWLTRDTTGAVFKTRGILVG